MFIWLGLFIEIMLLTLIKPFIIDFSNIVIIAVLLHIIFTTIIIRSYKLRLKIVFLGAFIARVLFMFWDLYASHIFLLPNSGADTEGFFKQAVYFSENILKIFTENGELYSKMNGLLFYFIGPQRILGQYINVLFGLSIVFIIYKILTLLDINLKIRSIIILIAAFFPNSLVMSAIFLREIIPTFLVAVSLYYFISWIKMSKYSNMLLSLIMLGLASMFHSGVIGIIIGYMFMFLFYRRETQTLKFTGKTVISFIVITFVVYIGVTSYGDNIFRKFGSVDNINEIYETSNSGSGGSIYLTNLEINNPIQLLVFAPIKSFFFLTAPLPIDWRGIMDVFTFFTDSSLYLGVLIYVLKNKKELNKRKILVLSFMCMIMGATIIFGIGVSNAGTAVRHRQKLIPVFLVLLGIIMDEKKKYLALKKN